MKLPAGKRSLLAGMIAAAGMSMTPVTLAAPAEKPNVLLVIMDDLGTGQLDFTLNNLDKKALSQRPVPVRYQGDLDKMIDAAQRAMPNVSLLDQKRGQNDQCVCGASGMRAFARGYLYRSPPNQFWYLQ